MTKGLTIDSLGFRAGASWAYRGAGFLYAISSRLVPIRLRPGLGQRRGIVDVNCISVSGI